MPTVEDDEFEDPGLGVINVLEPLEDLDDVEFGLPPVENPPSLEEILAEDGDLLRTIDDFEDDCTASGNCLFQSLDVILIIVVPLARPSPTCPLRFRGSTSYNLQVPLKYNKLGSFSLYY